MFDIIAKDLRNDILELSVLTNNPDRRRHILSLLPLDPSHLIQEYVYAGYMPEPFTNLYFSIPSRSHSEKPIVLLTSHFDIANPDSMNILDNTASCINLLYLAKLYASTPADQWAYDLRFAWIDQEESCRIFVCGIPAALACHNPDYHIDLELTASGEKIIGWNPPYTLVDGPQFPVDDLEDDMPFNLATVSSVFRAQYAARFRILTGNNIRLKWSTCLTMMTSGEYDNLCSRYLIDRWSAIHTNADDERWLNEHDCKMFILRLADSFKKTR